MTTPQDQAIRMLALPQQRYAGFDDALKMALQSQLADLAETDAAAPGVPPPQPPVVLALGAPAHITLADGVPVPVLVASIRSGLRDWQVQFKTNLRLFLRRLDGHSVLKLQPLVNQRRGGIRPASAAGAPPTGLKAQVVVSDVSRFDVRERLGPAIKPGRYAVTAVAGDWLSNTVVMQIDGPQPAGPDAAPAPYPGVRHVLDPRADLDARVDVPVDVATGQPARLRVALSVADDAVTAPAADGTAQWAGHVVVIGLDEEPLLVPLRLPVQRASGASGTARYNAVFQFDLRAAAPGISGKKLVYIEAGSRWLGPYPVTLSP